MNEVQNSGYTDTFRPALQSVFTVNQKLDFITKGLSAYARFSFDSYSEFNNKRTGGVDLWYTNQRDGNGELVFGKPIKEGSDELYYEHSDTGESSSDWNQHWPEDLPNARPDSEQEKQPVKLRKLHTIVC